MFQAEERESRKPGEPANVSKHVARERKRESKRQRQRDRETQTEREREIGRGVEERVDSIFDLVPLDEAL